MSQSSSDLPAPTGGDFMKEWIGGSFDAVTPKPSIRRRSTSGCGNSNGRGWLCALCLHPIGYYGDTWAGVMCPTDEVIAHLLMMRGSEEKYWANANQHPIDHPAAGV
jgi:hypothetical protein